MPDEQSMPVPPGLTRCPDCGEYTGSTQARHLNWNEPLDASELDEVIEVTCICQGTPCRRCGKKMHRPASNRYQLEANRIWHVLTLVGMFPCRDCRSMERPE